MASRGCAPQSYKCRSESSTVAPGEAPCGTELNRPSRSPPETGLAGSLARSFLWPHRSLLLHPSRNDHHADRIDCPEALARRIELLDHLANLRRMGLESSTRIFLRFRLNLSHRRGQKADEDCVTAYSEVNQKAGKSELFPSVRPHRSLRLLGRDPLLQPLLGPYQAG